MILSIVLGECETWFLTSKEGLEWKVFGRLLTNVFGPKKEQGPGGFETLRNASLRNLYLRFKY
jgi:hypothetical protein